MAYCGKCGQKMSDSAKFCSSCGEPNPLAAPGVAPTSPTPTPSISHLTGSAGGILNTLSVVELVVAVAWAVVAIYLAVIGFRVIGTLSVYRDYMEFLGWLGGRDYVAMAWLAALSMLALAAGTGFMAFRSFVFSAQLKSFPPMDTVSRYQKSLVACVAILVLMIIFQRIFGIVVSICVLLTRAYALIKKFDIERAVNTHRGGGI